MYHVGLNFIFCFFAVLLSPHHHQMAVDLGAEYYVTGITITWGAANGYQRWAQRWAIEVSSDPACNKSGVGVDNINCWCDLSHCKELREGDGEPKDRECWTQIFPATGFYNRASKGITLSSSNPTETLTWNVPSVSGRYIRIYIDQGNNAYPAFNMNAVQCGYCYNGNDNYSLKEVSFTGKKADSCPQDISPPTSCPSR